VVGWSRFAVRNRRVRGLVEAMIRG
jgi:hypothetical protein